MKIKNVLHKGLRRFIEEDDASGLPPQSLEKIHLIAVFLFNMRSSEELRRVPLWKVHRMTGDQKGKWSLIVTRNWRITFHIDEAESEIIDLDYEDYH